MLLFLLLKVGLDQALVVLEIAVRLLGPGGGASFLYQSPGLSPQLLYSDDLAKSRLTLFGRRYRPWFFIGAGWLLYLTLGNGIELWSNIFLVALVLGTLATPVLHLLGSAQFKAELAKLTP